MNLERVDLNLLTHLDVLLREKNVTRAAEQLGVTQPAMSNILRRLRVLFNDPLLIRSSEGMTATERALELQPHLREVLGDLSQILEPRAEFKPENRHRAPRKHRVSGPDAIPENRGKRCARYARLQSGSARHSCDSPCNGNSPMIRYSLPVAVSCERTSTKREHGQRNSPIGSGQRSDAPAPSGTRRTSETCGENTPAVRPALKPAALSISRKSTAS